MLSCRSPPAYLPCNLKRQAFVYLFMHFLLTLELALELPLPIKVSNLKITMGALTLPLDGIWQWFGLGIPLWGISCFIFMRFV